MVHKTKTAIGGTLAVLGIGFIAFNNIFQAIEFIKLNPFSYWLLIGFIIGSISLSIGGIFD